MVANMVLGSTEFQQGLTQSLFQQFLHRPADANGLAGAVGALGHGATDEMIIAALVGSAEFLNQV
jgi:hypothetical protein